ncbi:hypothetical protein BDY24DRAFT_399104 [Mrakia frigida]|uniref:uncharacterized protein n=1 Tax=Mrakia frigida TaxID=29902 RepID=UPI003FCC1230
MFPPSLLLLALSALAAPSFLSAPLVEALPTTTPHLHLARGWSHSFRLSSTLASRAYETGIPFTEADVITSNCIAQCIPVVALNSTCGTSYYQTDCNMCSTTGLDAFVGCANCWAQSKPSAKQRGEALKRAEVALAKIEQSCQSYTRTALPSLTLSLTASTTPVTTSSNSSSFAVQAAGTSSVASSSGGSRRVGLGGRLSVAVGAIVVVAGVIGVSLV